MRYTLIHPAWRLLPPVLILLLLAACAMPVQPANPTQPEHTTQPVSEAVDPTPTATLSTPPPCTQTEGRLVDTELSAPMLKYPLAVKVYLPPCYDYNLEAAYPTLYMLHGMTDTNDQWVSLGLTEAADRLITAGTIQPMLIVMPYEINWQLSPDQSGYSAAVTDVLIPWVEKTYRACTQRDCRAIGGLSRGGNWAVKIGFENWQLFTAIGAHSTPLFVGGILDLTTAVRHLPSPADAPAVYVDAGDKDENLAAVKDFEKTLTELHVAHEYHLGKGAHDAAYWSAHVEEYLLWYAGQFRK